MPKLRTLSGEAVITILGQFGFSVIKQRGSHAKLRRITAGQKETLLVPCHDEIDPGTLRAIFNQARRYLSEEELRRHFYTES